MTVAEDQISDYKAHHPRDIIYTITVNHLRTPELPTVNTLFRLDSEGILSEYEYRDNLFLRKKPARKLQTSCVQDGQKPKDNHCTSVNFFLFLMINVNLFFFLRPACQISTKLNTSTTSAVIKTNKNTKQQQQQHTKT